MNTMRIMRPTAVLAVLLVVLLTLGGCDFIYQEPTGEGSEALTSEAGTEPVAKPTEEPTEAPTAEPAAEPTAEPTPVPVPTQDEKIESLITGMSLEEKIGQMFIVRCKGGGTAVKDVSKYSLGAYVLFGDDFRNYTPDEVRAHIQSYQDAAELPMLIGVDEEGGTVTRVSSYSQFRDTPFDSPRNIFHKGGKEALLADAEEKSQLLKSLGINLNFAPDADLSYDEEDFMYERSIGLEAAVTGAYVRDILRVFGENGVGGILKHFPGYGNNADTHTGIAYDKRDYEQFENNDFLPFKTAIDFGIPCGILVAHNIVYSMDEDMPASLSKNVHNILRDDLGFEGVIMTDDLAMDAIGDFIDSDSAAVQAVKAGNDMLCCSDYEEQIPAVIAACENGEISEERIEESVRRILKWKFDIGIM